MFTYFVSFVVPTPGVSPEIGDTIVEMHGPVTDQQSLDTLREAVWQHVHEGGSGFAGGRIVIVNFILLSSPAVGVT